MHCAAKGVVEVWPRDEYTPWQWNQWNLAATRSVYMRHPGLAEVATGLAVDVHAHHVSRDLLKVDRRFTSHRDSTWGESLHFENRYLGPLIPRLTDLSLSLQDMDQGAISHRLCCSASWLTCYWAEPELGRYIARAINESLADAVGKHKDRLAALATLPLQDVDGSVEELRYAYHRLGIRGASAGTNVNGVYFDDPRFEPLFDALEELDMPLFLHPDEVAGQDRLKDYWLVRLIGNPHEATISLSRMILGGVLERHPKLKVCFPMGGGSVTQLLGRINHGWSVRPEARVHAPRPPAEYLRNCFFDTILHSDLSLRFLLEVVPPEQVVLGSDYPWDMGQANARAFVENSGISEKDRQLVLSANVSRLINTEFGMAVTN